jgi:translation initiation factor 3 subunit I
VLLSAAGDSSARLWSMESGAELFRFRFNEPARAARFSVGEKLAAVSTDPFMNSVSTIRIFNIAADPADQSDEEVVRLTGPRGRITRVHWVDDNRVLLSASEDGFVRRWDVETGKCLAEAKLHEKQIGDMQMSVDGTHFITASTDRTSKLVDTQVCVFYYLYFFFVEGGRSLEHPHQPAFLRRQYPRQQAAVAQPCPDW